MTDTKIHLELGDIIEIKAESDPAINNKIFYINYIDNKEINLLDNQSGAEIILQIDNTGSFENESITEIELLDRASESGYARQNELLPGTWVNIYLGGDLPTTVIGEITNLEEDQIEVKVWDRAANNFESDPLYLDFGYKGIPKDIPITSIDIREAPPTDSIQEATQKEETATYEILDADDEGEQIDVLSAPEIKEQIRDLIFEADQIVFGEDLEVIAHEVDVPEEQKKYTIEKQTTDMLDDLLSDIPNKRRTPNVINNIHQMINRYKQLREEFSVFDTHDNIVTAKIKGNNYKPLVDSLENFTQKLYWVLPVSKIKKKLYNSEIFQDEVDVVDMNLATARIEESNLIQSYYQNDIAGDNKYYSLVRGLRSFYTPFENPSLPQEEANNILSLKKVQTNISAVVNNFSNFDVSVSNNDEIKTKRFFIQDYILGANSINYTRLKGGNVSVSLNKITQNDTIAVSSMLMLPEPVFDFSKINLPMTNILVKANLNEHFIDYWRLLKKNTEVSTHIIENIDKEYVHQGNFLKTITEYSLDETIQEEDKYKRFLNSIIPSTSKILELFQENIHSGMSPNAILRTLEPFLIYQNDLTNKDFVEMKQHISDNITSFKKNYMKAQEKINRTILKFTNSIAEDYPYLVLLVGQEIYETFNQVYNFNIDTLKGLTNSAFLNHIISIDYGRYFNTLIAKTSLSLMIPAGVETIKKLEEFYNESDKTDQKMDTPKSEKKTPTPVADTCKNYVLAKKYTSLDDLEADNDKIIYFDKQYDKTYYELINESSYKGAIDPKATIAENIKSVADKLIENIGLKEDVALRDAKALLLKKREVENGDYGVLSIDDGGTTKSLYFVREDNKWVNDSKISDEVFGDRLKDICNLSEKCMIVNDSCGTLKHSERQIKNQNLLQLIKEFDTDIYDSQSDMTTKIEGALQLCLKRLPKLIELERKYVYKYNTQKYNMGGAIDISEQITSPHLKLRDTILGLADMTQRQNFICQFAVKFTRPANEGEDQWWKYCNDTSTKLLPVFIEELAVAFVNNDNYLRKIDEICKRQGKLSDDGEAWVDKYSGYFIKYIEFDTEEGYDDSGFKATSREIMEKENVGFLNIKPTTKKEKESPDTIMIYNVITTIADYMGLNIGPYIQDIIKDTIMTLKKYAPKKPGDDKKGSFVKKYNTILILLTLAYLFIYVQTSIPSLQTRKRFPGCKRSFSGFPLYGEEDLTGLDYIACVTSKISKSSIEPWNAIAGQKKDKIKTLLKKMLDSYILKNKSIKTKMSDKIKYLQTNQEELIPEYLDIKGWNNFLPPLVPIKMKRPENVTKVFNDGLQSDIKNGKLEQFNKILVLQSKIIYFSLEIQEYINNIVRNNVALLQNRNGEPYLENSCCDEGTINTVNYFATKNPQIAEVNKLVKYIYDIVLTLGDMGKAAILFYDKNTKPVYPPLLNEFSEETIYRAFIVYCKFNSNIVIDPDLQAVCLEKPEDFNVSDSIAEKIEKLKQSGKRYGQRELQELLLIVNRKNIVKFKLSYKAVSELEKLREMIAYSEQTDSTAFPQQFRTLLTEYIDRYNIGNPELDTGNPLLNYLDISNKEMLATIVSFLEKNLPRHKDNKIVLNCFKNIDVFNVADKDEIISGIDETTYKVIDFIKNILRFICEVYPNIIINKVDPCSNGCKIPKHWNLSDFHNNDLMNIINKYYQHFTILFGDTDITDNILKRVSEDNKEIYQYAMLTKYYAPIKTKTSSVKSIFSSELTIQLFKYYFYSTLLNFTGLIHGDDLIDKSGLEDTPEMFGILGEAEPVNPTKEEEKVAVQAQEGEIMSIKTKSARLLFVLGKVINNSKNIINYNYESLKEKVNKSKEQEKTDITDYLRDMTEEEREIENIFKTNKLEKWSKGSQKGFRTYQGKTYDEEREIIEKQAILERNVEKKNYVTELNKDIFMMEELERQSVAAEIEAEVNDLSRLPNDDDFGDEDGDEYY